MCSRSTGNMEMHFEEKSLEMAMYQDWLDAWTPTHTQSSFVQLQFLHFQSPNTFLSNVHITSLDTAHRHLHTHQETGFIDKNVLYSRKIRCLIWWCIQDSHEYDCDALVRWANFEVHTQICYILECCGSRHFVYQRHPRRRFSSQFLQEPEQESWNGDWIKHQSCSPARLRARHLSAYLHNGYNPYFNPQSS